MPCLSDVFKDDRFQAHDNLDNRRLLWHGTNVAVVAAILKSGLRIMPHSGGRVGKGIYLASENSKSACYGKVEGRLSITIYSGFRSFYKDIITANFILFFFNVEGIYLLS